MRFWKLALTGAAVATALAGCTTIQYDVNQNETDPIKFANDTRKAYNNTASNVVGSLLQNVLNTKPAATDYIRNYGDRREVLEYWEPTVPVFQSNAVTMSGMFIQQQFNKICANNGGHYANGWCVNATADTPLFWAQAIDRSVFVRECSSCNPRRANKIAMAVYAPSGKATDQSWKDFAYAQGFRSATQRNAEAKMLLSSKGRGATVCRIAENGVSPGAAIVERGYVEDANNGKLKIRIVAKGYLDQSISADGTELGETSRTQVQNEINVWAAPTNWFVCK